MKIALTGGASGIGAALARKMTAQGHRVFSFDIAKPEIDGVHWTKTDLSDPQSIEAALSQRDGSFDVLINNAGLPPRDGLERKILAVNFFGMRHFTEILLDRLTPGAAIVNVASRAGAMWAQNLAEVKRLMAASFEDLDAFCDANDLNATRAYNLSKEAVIVYTMQQTEAMIARGFRMNAVSPAAVSTGILDDFAKAFGEKMQKNVARVGRPGTPEEIADIILFLASNESSWIKGQDITIDGGMSALSKAEALEL